MTGLLLTLLLAAPPDADKLAAEYFTATEARRFAIREELKPVDALTKEDVAQWRAKLIKLAQKNGKKLRKSGTNYLYGKKEAKQGKYIVGGGRGKGGLIIALHGGGKGQGDAGGAASTFGGIASKFKCVMIAPEVLEKTEKGWTTSGTEEFLLELIEGAKRTWKKIPHDRIYMVGHSMGGYGSWTVGAHHVDLFAGLGPYAGAPTPITVDGQPYGEVASLAPGVIPNLRNVALHIYQSLDDKNVPPAPNIFANKRTHRTGRRSTAASTTSTSRSTAAATARRRAGTSRVSSGSTSSSATRARSTSSGSPSSRTSGCTTGSGGTSPRRASSSR